MEIIRISTEANGIIDFRVNFLVIFIIALILFAIFYIYKYAQYWNVFNDFTIDRAELGLSGQKIIIKPNYTDRQIAYKLWIETRTRKIGLQIDIEHDAISEIYDSWYDFFKITRELIKEIPVEKIRNDGTKQIVTLSIDILNEGLRPHLTKWQAKYRRWYSYQIRCDENKDLSPQEIQRNFPEYLQLIKEMNDVNKQLIKYCDLLKKLSFDK